MRDRGRDATVPRRDRFPTATGSATGDRFRGTATVPGTAAEHVAEVGTRPLEPAAAAASRSSGYAVPSRSPRSPRGATVLLERSRASAPPSTPTSPLQAAPRPPDHAPSAPPTRRMRRDRPARPPRSRSPAAPRDAVRVISTPAGRRRHHHATRSTSRPDHHLVSLYSTHRAANLAGYVAWNQRLRHEGRQARARAHATMVRAGKRHGIRSTCCRARRSSTVPRRRRPRDLRSLWLRA